MTIDKLSDEQVLNLTDEQVASIFIGVPHHESVQRLLNVMISNPDFNNRMKSLFRILSKISGGHTNIVRRTRAF
jgi:hypothetical protein